MSDVTQPEAPPSYEMACVLFLDIVGYSIQPMERQTELRNKLQEVVRGTTQFQQANAAGDLISRSTGDGMALVFFRDPVTPVRCAVEISKALRAGSALPLRMGIHSGPVSRQADIKNDADVVGGGINMAQRVMDCGDAGHILVSRTAGEVLEQLGEWRDALHDLGTCEVKHGVRIQLYNLYREGIGNATTPGKLLLQRKKASPRVAWRWPAIAALAIIAGVGAWYAVTQLGILRHATPAASSQRVLEYYVMVQKYRNREPYQQPFRLSGERVFEADYRIRLVVSSPQAGYLYVLNEGPKSTADKPDYNTLFPSPKTAGGSAELQPGREQGIPETGYFKFDEQKGKEKLWFIWSKAMLPELEMLKQWTNPEDLGQIKDSRQLQVVRAFLERHGSVNPSVEQDDAKKITVLRAAGDILARLLVLEHD